MFIPERGTGWEQFLVFGDFMCFVDFMYVPRGRVDGRVDLMRLPRRCDCPELAGDGPRPCAVIGEAHVRQCETCQAASKMPAPPHREAGTRRGGRGE